MKTHHPFPTLNLGGRAGVAFIAILFLSACTASAAFAEWSAESLGEGSGLDRGAVLARQVPSPVPGGPAKPSVIVTAQAPGAPISGDMFQASIERVAERAVTARAAAESFDRVSLLDFGGSVGNAVLAVPAGEAFEMSPAPPVPADDSSGGKPDRRPGKPENDGGGPVIVTR